MMDMANYKDICSCSMFPEDQKVASVQLRSLRCLAFGL